MNRKEIAILKIAGVVVVILVAIFIQSEFEPVPKKPLIERHKNELPIVKITKSLDPKKYITDQEALDLFCHKVCKAEHGGNW